MTRYGKWSGQLEIPMVRIIHKPARKLSDSPFNILSTTIKTKCALAAFFFVLNNDFGLKPKSRFDCQHKADGSMPVADGNAAPVRPNEVKVSPTLQASSVFAIFAKVMDFFVNYLSSGKTYSFKHPSSSSHFQQSLRQIF